MKNSTMHASFKFNFSACMFRQNHDGTYVVCFFHIRLKLFNGEKLGAQALGMAKYSSNLMLVWHVV